ncbi:hypothetical protein [Rhodohalobacter sp. SW132]|uniref:hypothetical protein n=1 Tax=Rhodohalobacter sp. SW132 TaxID=2293433 RepID=UPI0011C06FCE|nr:hypothetical protein [Rhodohalobacter sp. SW132]
MLQNDNSSNTSLITQETIEEFFADQFKNTSYLLLSYKDKQLLKNGEFREFAQKLITETRYFIWAAAIGIITFAYFTIVAFIGYGADPNWFSLTFGLSLLLAFFLFTLYSAKYYFTFKSSMSLFIKLLDKQEKSNAPK